MYNPQGSVGGCAQRPERHRRLGSNVVDLLGSRLEDHGSPRGLFTDPALEVVHVIPELTQGITPQVC